MRVHWTDNAISHLVNIYESIAHDSPIYAKRIVDRLTKTIRADSRLPKVRADGA